MKPRPRHFGYKKPSVAQRHARAVTFLINVKSLEGITAEWAAHQFDLALLVTKRLLSQELARRG